MKLGNYKLGDRTINYGSKIDSKKSCWRLIWNNQGQITDFFESNGVTYTSLNLFLCETKEEAEAKIVALNLIPLPEENESILEVQNEA